VGLLRLLALGQVRVELLVRVVRVGVLLARARSRAGAGGERALRVLPEQARVVLLLCAWCTIGHLYSLRRIGFMRPAEWVLLVFC